MPDIIDLKERYSAYRNRYAQNLRPKQEEWQEIYEQRNDLRLKGKIFKHPTYTPDAMLIVDRIAETYAMDKLVVHQPPKPGRNGEETKGAREQADFNEKWLRALFNENKENDPYFYREILKNLPYRGECYAGWDVHWDTLKDPEKFPGPAMEILVPDARCCMSSLEADKGEPDDFFWQKTVEVSHVIRKAEEWNKGRAIKLALGAAKNSDLVYLCEWWSKDWMAYFLADANDIEKVSVFEGVPFNGEIFIPNPLGFSPWLRAYSGLGTSPYDGDPFRPARGLLAGIEDILTQKSRSYTKRDSHTSRYVLPRVIQTVAAGYTPRQSDGTMDLGSVWKEDPTKVTKWREEQPPPIPEGLIQETGEQDRCLENYRPGVTRGVPMPGEPASSMATRLGLANLKDTPMESAARQTLSRLCSKALRIIDVMKATVTVNGLTISHTDIKGYYVAQVTTQPGNPEQLRFDYMLAMQLWDKIPNKRWIVENFLHVEDATQFLLDIDAELMKAELLKDPNYRRITFMRVFGKLGMEEEKKALEAQLPPPGMETGGGGMTEETPPGMGGSPALGVPAAASMRRPETPAGAKLRRQQEGMSATV